MPEKKMGRPTDGPKPFRLDGRVSKTDLDILDGYCARHEKGRPEALRDGIK